MNDAHGETVKDGRIDLSICMIVKNEEADIRACIESIRDVACEIVILDTGSTDRTVEIAGEMGAHIFSARWENDFAKARNQCLSHAGGYWVLFMDADERLAAESRIPLQNEVSTRPGRPIVYAVKFVNMNDENKVSSVHCAPRLFVRLPQVIFVGKLHEQICDADNKNMIPSILREDIIIEHHGYKKSILDARKKSERNESILTEMIQEDPENWYPHFTYGRHILTLETTDDRCREAIRHLRKADSCAAASGDTHTHSSICYYMANAYLRLREPEKAIGLLRKALELNDSSCDIYYTLGKAYSELAQWDRAIESFSQAMKGDHIDRQSGLRVHVADISQWIAPFEIGCIYAMQLNDHLKALDFFRKAELCIQSSPLIAVKLFNSFLHAEDPEKAAYYLYELRSLFPDFNECLPEQELFEYYMEHAGRDEAIAFTKRYRERLQRNCSLQFIRICGDAMRNAGDYQEALSFYSFASAIGDTDEDLFILQGHCHFKMKRCQEGIDCLEKGRQAFPESCAIDNNIAALYMETGNYEGALHYASEALRKNPEYPVTRFNLAKIEYNLTHYREALAHLDTLSEDTQYHDDGLFLSAVIYFDLKEYQRSIQILNTIIESRPAHLEAYRYLIKNFRAAGNGAVADSLEKALTTVVAVTQGNTMSAYLSGTIDEKHSTEQMERKKSSEEKNEIILPIY
ncbi:MAG: tetratricopeptide repeat protein [Candidatus Xenobiia bacterium LiM19]